MRWRLGHRFDADMLPIADRHYNRRKVGSPQFVPPGRCVVLKTETAIWVTSWPFAEYVRHQWGGAWINSAFRNEGPDIASELIREAVAVTRLHWPDVPALGMITFIDPKHVQPRKIHSRPTWGHCYFEAGFVHIGHTKAGLWAMQLTPERMPPAAPPLDPKLSLLDTIETGSKTPDSIPALFTDSKNPSKR